ncbi:MAG: GTP-binding protein [Ruminococcaceae bacterium]|nr:GTP-binding protein [Oscillospiraceae bacterium]
MKRAVIGILAHVDAGKTTLAEAMLYRAGQLRQLGRVDHGDTAMDTHQLERERGITIFASQAGFTVGELSVTLLDTPGHVDFSAETERTLRVLDYAVLVISGTEGVQAHTVTLWRLLQEYQVPTFVFVTKMDFARHSREELMAELRRELGDGCMDFSPGTEEDRMELLAMCREDLLETYLETGMVADGDVADLIAARQVFPCYFGSGLKLEGVDEFLQELERWSRANRYPEEFGARVFKISHDGQGNRLTHLKVTGGKLRVRDSVKTGEREEKVSQLRLYSGAKFSAAEEVVAGQVCAVLGLNDTHGGQGLGWESAAGEPLLEPVMNYRILLPEGCDARTMLPKLRLLEEEDPQLHISWKESLQEIHVSLMGQVQIEILRSLVSQRFGVEVEIDSGRVLYKETITDVVEGVGHYEPLRHYAEVHLLLEPLPLGSGLEFVSRCSEDLLDRNWQRLILTHLMEKPHLGVLTGSPATDLRITLAAGRAHLKHTEGGDFRQATYRAVRQGLMQAESVLLEPYYSFRLEIPVEQLGRAINDLRARHGTFDAPESMGTMSHLRGRAPVTALNGYAAELAAYTGGRGRLFCEVTGYDLCHNPEEVIAEIGYEAERDMENTPDSVFCAHGAGFTVKWDKVPEYMHLGSCLKREEPVYAPKVIHRNLHLDEKELEAIMEREFGPISRPQYSKPTTYTAASQPIAAPRKRYVLVDGYNVIFAWPELKELAQVDLDAARERLIHVLGNWAAFTHNETVLVFDGYKVTGGLGEKYESRGIRVVFTKEKETADMYMERLVTEIGKNDQVRVVSSDSLIQLSVLRSGLLRVSAREFEEEVMSAHEEIRQMLSANYQVGSAKLQQK